MKEKRAREEACLTCGHYHDYEGGEPCSICGHVMLPAGGKTHESCMPTTIINGFLYLGSYDTASRQELLKAMGVSHILNTVPTCPALYKNTFTYHTVADVPPRFEECFDFLDAANNQKQKVLVYCMSGITRSPTIVIAYLMKLRGWRLAESYKWVKDKRPQVHISENDTKRLQELEVQLHGSCSVPSGFAFISLPALSQPQQHLQQQQQQLPCNALAGQSQMAGSSSSCPAFTFNPQQPAPHVLAAGNFVFGAPHPPEANEMET